LKKTIKQTIKSSSSLFCLYKQFRAKIIKWTPTEKYIRKQWLRKFSEELDLENLQTYNEKLQWLKIYGEKDALSTRCADKLEVSKHVAERIGKEYLNELIAVYDGTKNIDFSKLPNQFVLKATHDSGSVLLKKENTPLDYKVLKEIECSLKINYGYISKEWVYEDIKPKIIIEKFLESEDGRSLKDYKIFCFDGVPRIIHVDFDRFEGHKRNFYDISWNKLDLEIEYPSADVEVKKPELLEKMLELTIVLAKGFPHVRVDWFIHQDKLVFGEMTYFHGSGFEAFNSKAWEIKMGGWLKLPEKVK